MTIGNIAVRPRPPLREPSGEMAIMLENIRASEEREQSYGGDLNMALETEYRLSGGLWNSQSRAPVGPEMQQLFIRKCSQPPTQSGMHIVEHKKEQNHGLLGGHLSLEIGEHVSKYASEAKAGLIAIKTNANQAASDSLDTAVNRISHVAGEHAQAAAHEGLSTALQVSGGMLAGASGILGALLLKVGMKDLSHGIRHKDAEHAIEGANTLVVGTRSLAAGVSMAGHLVHGSQAMATVASAAHGLLTPLGIVHGAVDAGLGVKDVVQGLRHDDKCKLGKGILSIGLGGSLIAAAAGGGLPAILVAAAFLTGKVAHTVCHDAAHQKPPQEGHGVERPLEKE